MLVRQLAYFSKRQSVGILLAAALIVAQFAPAGGINASAGLAVAAAASTGNACGLTEPAFCETFDAPSPRGAGTRSGDLDGVLWGVSRATSNDNPSAGLLYGWAAATRSTCGYFEIVGPGHDVAVCNGQMVETV